MFSKKVNYNSNKEMFEFLHNHFQYDVLNSWNKLKTIANNVKLYNLPVNYADAMKALEEDDWFTVNDEIKYWEEMHPGTNVFFNGRSGGYIVLGRQKDNCHIFEGWFNPSYYDNYEDWKKDVQENYGPLKDYHHILVDQVKLVQSFDTLCDDLILVVQNLIDDMHDRENRTHKWKAVKKHEYYVYDTLEDMNYHKQYMFQHGAKLFDESESDLYVEYEVDIYDEGEVTLDE